MICQNCRFAGDLTTEPGALIGATMKLAAEFHQHCANRGCCCQHRIPDKTELIRRRWPNDRPDQPV